MVLLVLFTKDSNSLFSIGTILIYSPIHLNFAENFEASEALLQQLGLARGIPTVAVAQNLLRHNVLAKHGGNGRFYEYFHGGFSLVSWMLMAIFDDFWVVYEDFDGGFIVSSWTFYAVSWWFMMILWSFYGDVTMVYEDFTIG